MIMNKMRKMMLRAGLTAMAIGAAIPAQAANLFVNGGFESPAGPDATFGAGANIGGWTVTGDVANAVAYINTSYAEPGITFPSHGGNYSIDITGFGNTGPNNGIFQTVSTTIGTRYDLRFWLGNQASFGGSNSIFYTTPSIVRLEINGLSAGSPFVNALETSATVNWQLQKYSFIASSTSTKIAFLNGTPTVDNYAGLDDISLTTGAVPEPASWALMIAGFGLTGAAMRRRGFVKPKLA
jgi:hypothetical protein